MGHLASLAAAAVLTVIGGCATTRSWYHLPAAEFDRIDYGFQLHSADVDGKTIAYIDEGRGERPLLLIHGLGTNAKSWQRNIPAWSRDHRVIALDLAGYGHSSKAHYPYSLAFHVATLTGLLDALGIDQAIWVGHSMGGQVALSAALHEPDRVAALVLLSSAGFEPFTDGESDWMKRTVTPELVKSASHRAIASHIHANFYRTPQDAEFFITDRIRLRGASDFDLYCYAVWRNVVAMLDAPLLSRLPEIERPTLIVFGENDQLIPNPYLHGGFSRAVAERGQRAIGGSKLLMLPQCGHMSMFEKADEVNAAVLEFVSELEG